MCTTVGRRLLDGVLPPLCLGCGEIVETPGALCATCWPGFSFIAPPHCERCGTPLEEDLGAGAWCAACLARPPRFTQARAVFVYDEKSRRLVLPLKHGDRTDLARSCGLWMARAGAELLAGADIVVPVPLHWRRLFTRRYNQALLLARNVVRAAPATVSLAPDLLVRRRWTGSQAGLAARERRHNVKEAFAVHPRWAGRLAGKAVVLVDDVLTTGATADACVRALQRGGARRVDVLTLARVVRPAL